MFLLLLLLLTSLVDANDFKFCSANLLGLNTITLNPHEPIQNKDLHIILNGNSTVSVSGGRVDVVVRVHGFIFSEFTLDLCSNIKCPVVKNQVYNYDIVYKVPESRISVSAVIDVSIYDNTNLKLTCIEIPVTLQEISSLYKFFYLFIF